MLTFDYNFFMDKNIGEEHGISEAELNSIEQKALDALRRMDREKGEGKLGFLELPYDENIIKDIRSYRKETGGKFNTIGLIGIGGSALGPQALKNSLAHLYLNELDDKKRGDIYKVYFFDNVDPFEIKSIFDVLEIEKTIFIVISKSGGTTETNANFAILLKSLKEAAGEEYKNRIIAITDPEKGILRQIASEEGFKTFSVPQNVGGRFSILSAVGLVMAEFIGIETEGLLKGAQKAIDRFYGRPLKENAPLLNASFHYLFDTLKNKRVNVLMPYTRKLFLLADWYKQLWAESLGKNLDINGNRISAGLTPVSALGTIDQHSQLQLYLEGPNDKVITFLKLEEFDDDVEIPEFYSKIPELQYLSHRSLRKLNGFEESATELALKEESRPNASIIIPGLDAENIGEFIMFMEMQTAYAGYLYNINPFDQPAVEKGKQFTFGLMDRRGFEKYKELFANGYNKLDKYII